MHLSKRDAGRCATKCVIHGVIRRSAGLQRTAFNRNRTQKHARRTHIILPLIDHDPDTMAIAKASDASRKASTAEDMLAGQAVWTYPAGKREDRHYGRSSVCQRVSALKASNIFDAVAFHRPCIVYRGRQKGAEPRVVEIDHKEREILLDGVQNDPVR